MFRCIKKGEKKFKTDTTKGLDSKKCTFGLSLIKLLHCECALRNQFELMTGTVAG